MLFNHNEEINSLPAMFIDKLIIGISKRLFERKITIIK